VLDFEAELEMLKNAEDAENAENRRIC